MKTARADQRSGGGRRKTSQEVRPFAFKPPETFHQARDATAATIVRLPRPRGVIVEHEPHGWRVALLHGPRLKLTPHVHAMRTPALDHARAIAAGWGRLLTELEGEAQ